MNYNKNEEIIKKILHYCIEILEIKNELIKSLHDFEMKYIYRHACCMCIIQIGELSVKLSNDFKQKYDGVPWNAIRGMRNLFAHEYEKLDYEVTWNVIENSIPKLKIYCETILNDL